MTEKYTLQDGETIAWQAKPAPRCYTFRHWRHSIFGLIFLAICSYWQILGIAMATEYATPWLAWLPIPFVLIGLYFFCGHLLQARLEWNNVIYLITNRRVIAVRGILFLQESSLSLNALTYFRLQMQGEQLGTMRIYQGSANQLVMHCLEHPRTAVKLLEEALKENSEGRERHSEGA